MFAARLAGFVSPSLPSRDGRAAPGADDELVEDEPVAALRTVGAEDGEGVPALPGGRDPVGDQLRERAVERVEHPEARDAAHRRGARHDDLRDGAGLRQHRDRPERAGRVRHLEGERAAHRLVDAGHHERARAVERASHHRRRVGQVGDHLVAVDRDTGRDRDVARLDPVRAEVVGEGRGAVRPGRDLLPDEPLGVVDQVDHQPGQLLAPVPHGKRLQRALGHRAGRHLGAEVAERHARDPHVRLDQLVHLLDRLALGVEPQPRHAEALLEDLRVVARARARQAPADVAVVRGRDREADQRVVEVHGLDDEDVLQVHAPVEGVVHDEHVAGADAVAVVAEQRVHRRRDRAEMEGDADGLRDRLAAGVAERGREVHPVAHDGRVRGADDRRRHLVGDRLEGVRDDLQRHGIGVAAESARPQSRRDLLLEHERPRLEVAPHAPAAAERRRSCRTRRRAAGPPRRQPRSTPASARARPRPCRRATCAASRRGRARARRRRRTRASPTRRRAPRAGRHAPRPASPAGRGRRRAPRARPRSAREAPRAARGRPGRAAARPRSPSSARRSGGRPCAPRSAPRAPRTPVRAAPPSRRAAP